MSTELDFMSAIELRGLIASKQASPVEIVARAITRMHEVEPKLNNFVTMTEDAALDAARDAAYGWPADLSDEKILERLFRLNQERAAEKQ